MDHAARGKAALNASSYEDAITHYTKALQASPTSPDYLIQRSTAYQRAKNYTAALTDAEAAVVQAHKRAKREFIIESQFRRGCALHSLERYGDAEFVFRVVKRMDEKHKTVATFIMRNTNSMNKLEEGDERRMVTVKEMPDVVESSIAAASQEKAPANGSTASSPKPVTAPQQTPADKIRHEWYQNSEYVYFTLLAKGIPQDKAQIDIQERSLSISFPLNAGSSYDFTLDPLFAAIIPEKSNPKIFNTKLEVVLAKALTGQKWSALEGDSTMAVDSPRLTSADTAQSDAVKQAVLAPAATTSGPAYPTSSKSGPKNWDKIVSDARKADNPDKKAIDDDDDEFEGGDEANHFFKKLFKGATPEVQRAMMKSYTESNGTALSTDWGEVSKGKVEVVPPDGMEAKPYDQ